MFGFDFSFGLISSSKRERTSVRKSNDQLEDSYKYTSKWRTKPQIHFAPIVDTHCPSHDYDICRNFTSSTIVDNKQSSSHLTVDNSASRMEPKKVLFVGDSYSGKSSLLDRVEQKFRLLEQQRSIKHFEQFGVCYSKLTSSTQNMVLMDVEGATSYTHLHSAFSSSIDFFVVCFDLNRPSGLENAYLEWIKHISEAHPNIPFMVAACKSDTAKATGDRQITVNGAPRGRKSCKIETYETACLDWGAVSYIECSSWTISNIELVYDAIIDKPKETRSPSPMKRKNSIKNLNATFRLSLRRKSTIKNLV